MSKTLAYKSNNVVPLNYKPWNKYVDKIADQVIDKAEARVWILVNDMAEAGDPSAQKILMQTWKEMAAENEMVHDDE